MTLTNEPLITRSAMDRVWESLELGGFKPQKRRGDSFKALCPIHGDTNPSLSVRYDRGREAVLLHCFSCDARFDEILGAIGLNPGDAFDSPLPERTQDAPRPRRTTVKPKAPRQKLPARLLDTAAVEIPKDAKWDRVTVYPYFDADGVLVEEVIREHTVVDGITHKRFKQRFRGASGRMVTTKPANFSPVLYHHSDVLTGIQNGATIWLLEGEKDVDNAIAHGLVATTNAQGANSFPAELAAIFTGTSVAVVADRDTAGYKRAVMLHENLTAVGASVELFQPAVTDAKADLTDHFDAGHSVDQLKPLTLDEARLRSQLGEISRAIGLVEIARAEAIEQMRYRFGDDEHLAAARIWAAESYTRFQRAVELAAEVDLGSPFTTLVDELGELLRRGAAEVESSHASVDMPSPAGLDKYHQEKTSNVITIRGGSEPPRFLGNDLASDDEGGANEGSHFVVRRGETVQVRRERDGDGYRNRYHRIIRGWAEVQEIFVDDDGSNTGVSGATTEIHLTFYRWVRNAAGKPIFDADGQPQIEESAVRWDAEKLRDGSWAQSLPWPAMLESSTRRGKDNAWDAIFNARPAPSQRSTVYTTSGWRESDAGPFFVHAGGAIAKGGELNVRTNLPDSFHPFKLPAPSQESKDLREAWIAGTSPIIDELPARVMAPLLGVVWESVFERVPLITHLQGGRAAYKTSIARVACQYFAPELNYHGKREILSGANMGGTTIGLIRSLATANHLPVLIDDIAPDGDVKRAQKKLSELARLIYNGTGRVTGKQRGGVTSDQPSHATVITTGEMGITGSAQTRMLSIPLDPGAIKNGSQTFGDLERRTARDARGLLGSSLIRYIAEHRDQLRAEAQDAADNPNDPKTRFTYWQRRVSTLPHDEGLRGRLVEIAMAADHGIHLMLRMLVGAEAISRTEANTFYQWAIDGIFEAVSLQDSSSGDPAEQLLGYLREALASGSAHLTDVDGGFPENPSTKGWISRGSGDYATWNPSGPRIGVIKEVDGEKRVYLIPSVVLGVANSIAQRADETFAETSVSISSAMASHGWLRSDNSGKRGVGRRIGGQLMRVWDIPLTVIEGFDGDEPGEDSTTPEPNIDPTLFDAPGHSVADVVADSPADQSPATAAQTTPQTPPVADTSTAAQALASPDSDQLAVKTRSASVATTTPFRASLAVLDTDGLWLPDGEFVQLSEPIRHLGDFTKIVSELKLGTKNGWRNEDGQIYLTAAAALELGIAVDQLPAPNHFDFTKTLQDLTRDHPLITGAFDAGYQVGGKEKVLNATTRIWHSGNDRLRARVVLLPALKDDFKHIVADDPTPTTIARRLQRFADALQAPYAVSASSTGIDLMLTLHWRDRQKLYAPSEPVPPAEIATLEADIDWHRQPTETELKHEFVHAYDRGGSYLAGISGLELGIGSPTYFAEGRAFDKRLPGYWRVEMPEKAEWLTPNPIDPRHRDADIAGKLTWVSTPTLDVATSLGYEFQVTEAYVWEEHSRILDTWYGRVRDARTALDTPDVDDQAARDLLKEVYVRSLGLTASFDHHKGRLGFAPERYHFIQARARANIIRRIHQIGNDTGRWPVAISKDTVIYTSDSPDAIASWPGKPEHFGRGLGQYKYERSGMLTDHLPFLTGHGRYEGKDHLDFDWIG